MPTKVKEKGEGDKGARAPKNPSQTGGKGPLEARRQGPTPPHKGEEGGEKKCLRAFTSNKHKR